MDTSVLVAGIAGFKSPEITPKNPSAKPFRDWIERDTFVWLITDEIISEYKRILALRHPRRNLLLDAWVKFQARGIQLCRGI